MSTFINFNATLVRGQHLSLNSAGEYALTPALPSELVFPVRMRMTIPVLWQHDEPRQELKDLELHEDGTYRIKPV